MTLMHCSMPLKQQPSQGIMQLIRLISNIYSTHTNILKKFHFVPIDTKPLAACGQGYHRASMISKFIEIIYLQIGTHQKGRFEDEI